MPEVIQGTLADWVEDHVDNLIAELAPVGDKRPPVIEEHGTDDDDGGNNDGDDASP